MSNKWIGSQIQHRHNLWIILVIAMIGLLGVSATISQAQYSPNDVVWSAQFFNNPYLLPPAAFTRQDTQIWFNWGSGSPAPGVNADNFTARWSTSVNLPAGTYRFYVQADDGVHVIIDNNDRIIDTFNNPQPGQLLTADIALSAGTHNIQVDFRENTGDAYIYFEWANLSTNPVPPSFPIPQPVPPPQPVPVAEDTWVAEYFNNMTLTGSPIAIENEISPTHNWGSGSPLPNVNADQFSVRWTSNLLLEGTYQLSVQADDGVRVYVDGVRYIDEWHSATGATYTATFSVPFGSHSVVIEYYEDHGLAFLTYTLELIGQTGTQPPSPDTGSDWTAQYYANPTLSGSPVVTVTEASPTHNWGTGSPYAGIPDDNFSALWSSQKMFDSGTYQIAVQADDGVRVLVDDVTIIDEWHAYQAELYTAFVSLLAGYHTIVVEYYEITGNAFISFNISYVAPYTTETTPPTITEATATVTAYRLNVRSAPNATNANVIAQISGGETYPVVGRSQDSSWWEIQIGNTTGWVYENYVTVSNAEDVPVTGLDSQSNDQGTGFVLQTLTNLNIRSGPGTRFALLGIIPQGRSAGIIARNSSNTWWYVNYKDVVGWVSGAYVQLPANLDYDTTPVR